MKSATHLCGIFTIALPGTASAAAADMPAQPLLPVMLTLLASFFGALLLLALWASWRQRRLLRELRRREALFAAFFDHSPVGLGILDRELRYLRANCIRATGSGLTPATMTGMAMADATPAAGATVLAYIHDLIVAGRVATGIEIEGCGPDRDRHWLVSWFPLHEAAGAVPSGIGEVVLDVTDAQRARDALTKSAAQVQRLAAHREDEREREYRRLAREFHDELGQTLTGAKLQLQMLEQRLPDDAALRTITHTMSQMLAEAYRSTKTIAAELRPPALNLGLAAAIEWQAERALAPKQIRWTLALTDCHNLPDAQATALFRIVQEAMTNIVRYAGATTVHVSLRDDAGDIVLTIADDGAGFDPAGVDRMSHFGLAGMAERAQALGGRLDIDAAPGEGTRIGVRLPRTHPTAPGTPETTA